MLLVQENEELLSAWTQDLSGAFRGVDAVASVEEAILRCATDSYDIVITDSHFQTSSGVALIEHLRAAQPKAQSVLVSSATSAVEYESALQAGAARVLLKPVATQDLCSAVADAIERRAGFHSDLHGVSLVDILQLYHHARRSVALKVGGGQIHLRAGEIVHAELRNLTGEGALQQILSLESGAIQSGALLAAPVTIRRSFQAVILDALRQLDEQQTPRGSELAADVQLSLPPDLFDSGPSRKPSLEPTPSPVTRTLDAACTEIVRTLEGAVSFTVCDCARGGLIGTSLVGPAQDPMQQRVASATYTLIRDCAVERHSSPEVLASGNDADEFGVDEMYLATEQYHFFAKVFDGGNALALLVLQKHISIGLGWTQMKAIIAKLGPTLTKADTARQQR